MAGELTAEDARKELARRELERRRAETSTGMDMLKSGLTGVRRGIESGIGGFADVSDLNARGASWLAEKLGASPETAETVRDVTRRVSLGPLGAGMKTSELQEYVTDPVLGEEYQPQTTAGEYSRTVGEFLPAATFGRGSAAERLVTQALLPALASEGASQFTEKFIGEKYAPYARIVAALATPFAIEGGKRLITPFPASPERTRMADIMADEGVDLTAGQRTGSDRLRYMESELGGVMGQRFMENQGEQFTRAALSRAGINADRATPEVIDAAFDRIGTTFDDLAARNTLQPDRQFIDDLRGVFDDYGAIVPESARAPVVTDMANDIVTAAQQGGIGGEAYQALRSRLDRMARTSARDPQLSEALRGFRTALDDAMERTIATSNPADAGAWQEARRQYRNMLVLEQAATGAGENAASGVISPSSLRNATVSKHGRRNYARGDGDFAELSRAAEATMKPLPNSGTSGRLSARNMGASILSLLGAGGGSAVGGSYGAIAGALAGSMIPGAAGRVMLSGPGRAALGNQLFANRPATDPRMLAIVNALLASKGGNGAPAIAP